MKILLINPPWIRSDSSVWSGVASIMPPLGLAWIAAVLEQEKHEVEILDTHALRMDHDKIREELQSRGKYDIYGITATTALIRSALQISKNIKQLFSDTITVLGGVHPTVLPEEVIKDSNVDIVVRGEGEHTLLEIADGKPLTEITGITYRDGEEIIHTPERELIADLNDLPLPAYHLLPMDKYHPAAGAAKNLPATSMLATRGCPGRCTFCYRIFGPRLRVRKGERIAEELKLLYDKYGIREICFYDDTFTAVKKEIRAFCECLKEMKLDLTWNCFSRVDSVDEEILKLMKETGCHQVMYGIESGSEKILTNIGKRADLEKAIRAVKLTQEAGLDVRAAFMLGNPGETKETIEETINLAIRLNPELAIFNITTPFPGTEMFEWADKEGYLLTYNWEDYDLAHAVMELPTISRAEVQEYYNKAYRRFFFRPAYMLSRLKQLTTWNGIKDSFRGIKTLLKM
ncbi:MAG: B12-binding domain-containing radical SAM protein [Planctomycetota bacterium]|jgi:radical SAM superfamily enzyme YgiQ (UPF0313 family)